MPEGSRCCRGMTSRLRVDRRALPHVGTTCPGRRLLVRGVGTVASLVPRPSVRPIMCGAGGGPRGGGSGDARVECGVRFQGYEQLWSRAACRMSGADGSGDVTVLLRRWRSVIQTGSIKALFGTDNLSLVFRGFRLKWRRRISCVGGKIRH